MLVDLDIAASGVIAVLFVVARATAATPESSERHPAGAAQRAAAPALTASAAHNHAQRSGTGHVAAHPRPPRWMRRPGSWSWFRRSQG